MCLICSKRSLKLICDLCARKTKGCTTNRPALFDEVDRISLVRSRDFDA